MNNHKLSIGGTPKFQGFGIEDSSSGSELDCKDMDEPIEITYGDVKTTQVYNTDEQMGFMMPVCEV